MHVVRGIFVEGARLYVEGGFVKGAGRKNWELTREHRERNTEVTEKRCAHADGLA